MNKFSKAIKFAAAANVLMVLAIVYMIVSKSLPQGEDASILFYCSSIILGAVALGMGVKAFTLRASA